MSVYSVKIAALCDYGHLGGAHSGAATAGASSIAVTRGVLRAGVTLATGVTVVDAHTVIVLGAGVARTTGVTLTLLLTVLAVHAIVCTAAYLLFSEVDNAGKANN